MELHQVQYFVALARYLNFTRAAEHCGVTQPAFTKAIGKLEKELGGELICRERHLSHLTDLGRHVLPLLERCAAAAQKASEVAAKVQRQQISSVRIALSTSVSATLIADPLRETANSFEGLGIEILECECQGDLLDALLAGKADVGIGGGPIGHMSDRIDHWVLFEEEFVLLMNGSDSLVESETIAPEKLRGLHWLVRNGCSGTAEFRSQSLVDPSGTTHRGARVEHLQHMVAAGLGVMLLPQHYPRIGTVVARSIAGSPIRHCVRLFAVAGRRQTAPLRAFLHRLQRADWACAKKQPSAA